MKKLLLWRRLCQIGILLFFVLVPLLNLYGAHKIYGNLLAFNFFGLHLVDPLSALQVCIGLFSSGSEGINSIAVSNQLPSEMLWGAFFVLIIAFLLGPVFCSWLCPYGFFSELVWKIRGQKSTRATGVRQEQGSKVTITNNASRSLKIKIILFLIGITGVVFLHQGPILNQLSLPAWYTRLWQHAFLFGNVLFLPLVFIVTILCIELVLQKRIWCAYICPQSVLITLIGSILPNRLRVKFSQKSCTCSAKNRACVNACSLLLNPRDLTGFSKIACTNCGDCVHACQHVCKAEKKALEYLFLKKK